MAKNKKSLARKRKIKVLICDPLDSQGLKLFQKEGSFRLIETGRLAAGELKKAIRDAEGVIVRSGTRLTGEVIREAHKLQIIGRAGVGLDNVDVNTASKKGVIVVNTPEGNTISAAEHTMSLILAMARNITPAHMSMKEGRWDRKKFMGVELMDKTLGLIGLGRIGIEVARRAQSFGMHVLAFDPYLRAEKAQEMGVKLEELNNIYRHCDFISLHMPLTEETHHTIDAEALRKMKKGMRIVNCARGGLIDEKALLKALSRNVAGAALDVFESEPPGKAALVDHPKVVVTPHLGASTGEAQLKVSLDVSRTMIDYFMGKGLRNAVNTPALEPELLREMEPYIHLAEKLGLMHAQLAPGEIREAHISYHGDLLEKPTASVLSAFLKGLLTPILAENVNYVNASFLAKDRQIRVKETKSTAESTFTNLIAVALKTSKGRKFIAGTLFARNNPRIVMMDDLRIDFDPKGCILVIHHKDVPGIVGHIGTFLGKNRINIADMTVGRKKPGGDASTLISIDSPTSAQVIRKIKRLKNIFDAKLIKL